MTPSLRLAWAVLDQALADLERARRAVRSRRDPTLAEIEGWFRGGPRWWPFTFEAICMHVRLDPSAVRRALRITDAPPAERRPPSPVAYLERRYRRA
ncbi:MAG: hypothetical protein KIT14_01385 [bacterium]|nr:hypothetical protein [bacterium]